MNSSMLLNGTGGKHKVYEPSEREKDLLESLELSSIVIEKDPLDPNRYFKKENPGDWYRTIMKGKPPKDGKKKSKGKSKHRKKSGSSEKDWNSDGDDRRNNRRRSRSRYDSSDTDMISSDSYYRKSQSSSKHSRSSSGGGNSKSVQSRPRSADSSSKRHGRSKHSKDKSYDKRDSAKAGRDSNSDRKHSSYEKKRPSSAQMSQTRYSTDFNYNSFDESDSDEEVLVHNRTKEILDRVVESTPVMTEKRHSSADSRPRVNENRAKVIESKPMVVESRPKIIESTPKVVQSSPQIVQSRPKVIESKPKEHETQKAKVIVSQPSLSKPPSPFQGGNTVQEIVQHVNNDNPVGNPASTISSSTYPGNSAKAQSSPSRPRSSIFTQKNWKPTENSASANQTQVKRPDSVPPLNLTGTGDAVLVDDDGFEEFDLMK